MEGTVAYSGYTADFERDVSSTVAVVFHRVCGWMDGRGGDLRRQTTLLGLIRLALSFEGCLVHPSRFTLRVQYRGLVLYVCSSRASCSSACQPNSIIFRHGVLFWLPAAPTRTWTNSFDVLVLVRQQRGNNDVHPSSQSIRNQEC